MVDMSAIEHDLSLKCIAPKLCAASSINVIPLSSHSSFADIKSAVCPNIDTTMIAFVFSVIF